MIVQHKEFYIKREVGMWFARYGDRTFYDKCPVAAWDWLLSVVDQAKFGGTRSRGCFDYL